MDIKERLTSIRDGETRRAQFARFIINGCLAAGVHYGVYLLLLVSYDNDVCGVKGAIGESLATGMAYVVGYLVSFALNFYVTCVFTFRTEPTWRRFVGFSGSHVVNFVLHNILFPLCLYVGLHRLVAPFVVMGIAMLVQFTILRFVFGKR